MKVKYTDHRPIFIPYLESRTGGVVLPNETNIIEVTTSEFSSLQKMRNGTKKCFEKIKPVPVKVPETSEE